MQYDTIYDATYAWVNSFNAIPTQMLDEWNESRDGYGLKKLTPSDETEGYFPMWGTMWSFGDSCDDWWLEDNVELMHELGFSVFESEDYGYFFGIDGAGYDFYEAHWIPLYKARGLHWHKEENE